MATLPSIKPITAADVERLDNDKIVEIVGGDLLPGLSLDVADVFDV